MTVFFHPDSGDYFSVPANCPIDPMVWQVCNEVDPCKLLAGTVIQTTLGRPSVVLPSFDLEVYSEVGYRIEERKDSTTGKSIIHVEGVGPGSKGGLPVVGTAAFAEHPSTQILSMVYDLKDGKGRRFWMPGLPDPVDLLEHIRAHGLIEAWNVTFEYWVWNMVAVRRLGWPVLRLTQCRCAMAKSRRYSLPGSLDLAAEVLGTPRKDKRGKALITLLTRPHTTTNKRHEIRWTPATAWKDFCALYQYNDGDVVAEDHASAHIPDLTPQELEVWLMDQVINVRGVQVDMEALDAALEVLRQAEIKYTAELSQLTDKAVQSVSETARMRAWLATQGVILDNLKKDTVEEALDAALKEVKSMPPQCVRALTIRQMLGSANVKKLFKIRLQVSSDGRLRNQYMYCGADRTGRWSSAAADDDASNSQLQNVTAKGPDMSECEGCGKLFGTKANKKCCPRCGCFMFVGQPEWNIDGVEQAIEDIKTRSLEFVERMWGPALVVLCGILRGLFIAKPGHRFVCVDFTAIEAVVAACLARCQWRIDVFSTHGKIYEQSASNATGIPFQEILDYKKKNKVHHPARKGVGKIRELAGGYGGWIGAWKNFGADEYFANDQEIKDDVLKWRAESWEIVEMWGDQFRKVGPGRNDWVPELFGLEGAAISAILNPGRCYAVNDIVYGVQDDILFCRLPSGRFLHYHRPKLVPGVDKLKRGACWKITFEGYNSNSKKGKIGWIRMETYGGRLFENVVQAVSLDLQAGALLRCEGRSYPIVMHTHDEGCAEVPDGQGSKQEMCDIMAERPKWAAWWPIKAAGWEDRRYQKD